MKWIEVAFSWLAGTGPLQTYLRHSLQATHFHSGLCCITFHNPTSSALTRGEMKANPWAQHCVFFSATCTCMLVKYGSIIVSIVKELGKETEPKTLVSSVHHTWVDITGRTLNSSKYRVKCRLENAVSLATCAF